MLKGLACENADVWDFVFKVHVLAHMELLTF